MRFRQFLPALLAAAMLSPLGPASHAADAIGWHTDLPSAQREAAASGKYVLAHFWAPWCGPCRALEQNVFPNPHVAAAIRQDFVPVKLNVDEHRTLAKELGVGPIPCDVVLTPHGQVLQRKVSPQAPTAYVAAVTAMAQAAQQRSDTYMAVARQAESSGAETQRRTAAGDTLASAYFAAANTVPFPGYTPAAEYGAATHPHAPPAGGPGSAGSPATPAVAAAPPAAVSSGNSGSLVGDRYANWQATHSAAAAHCQPYQPPVGASPAPATPVAPYGAGTDPAAAAGQTIPPAATAGSFPWSRASQGQVPAAHTTAGQPPVAQHPIAQPPMAQHPFSQQPVGQPPVTHPPAVQPPMAQQPIAQQPVVQHPIAQYPVGQRPVTQPPVVQQPVVPPPAQTPFAQQPTVPQPAAQPPTVSPGGTATATAGHSAAVSDDGVPHPAQRPPAVAGADPPDVQTPSAAARMAGDAPRGPQGPGTAASPAQAAAAGADTGIPQIPPGNPPLAFEGYCVVTMVERGTWQRGNVAWGARHRGRTYLFAGPDEQQRFLRDPDTYAPVLSGHDVVRYLEGRQLVAGDLRLGQFFEGRIYLFADRESVEKFQRNPEHYARPILQALLPGARSAGANR